MSRWWWSVCKKYGRRIKGHGTLLLNFFFSLLVSFWSSHLHETRTTCYNFEARKFHAPLTLSLSVCLFLSLLPSHSDCVYVCACAWVCVCPVDKLRVQAQVYSYFDMLQLSASLLFNLNLFLCLFLLLTLSLYFQSLYHVLFSLCLSLYFLSWLLAQKLRTNFSCLTSLQCSLTHSLSYLPSLSLLSLLSNSTLWVALLFLFPTIRSQ